MRRVALLWIAFMTACSGGGEASTMSAGQPAPDAPRALEWETDEQLEGLKLRLSEASRPYTPGQSTESGSEAGIRPLDAGEVARHIARLPPLEMESGDRSPFAKREESEPPPRTGATVPLPFPPPTEAEAPQIEAGPARILRHAPEGEVDLAPHLSVTFSQPMVALSTQDAAGRVQPLRLSPEPAGQWRWVGTRTLLFEPDPRFPMATEYTVELKQEARTASDQPVQGEPFRFSTPPVQLQTSWPHSGPIPLDPVIFVGFDQAIEAEAILPHLRLVEDEQAIPLRPATPEQVAEDEQVQQLVEQAQPGRFLTLVPAEPLRPGRSYAIRLAAGAPSAEGPLLTTAPQSESFWTYRPLAVQDQGCSRGLNGCLPGGALWIRMNNPLDEAAFDAQAITISPGVEELRVRATGSGIHLHAQTEAETRYTVRLPPELRDAFGQELGEAVEREFSVGRAPKQLQGPGKEMLTLDPSAPPAFSVYSVNHERLRVRIYDVEPQDYPRFSEWMREARYDGKFSGRPARRQLLDRVIPVEAYAPEEMVETAIDLEPYLEDGHGQLVLWVEPVPQARERWEREDILAWVQVTELGLSAFVDQDELLAWSTRLATGSPQAEVELSLLGGPDSTARSDAQGLARLDKYQQGEDGPHVLVARHGADVALLPEREGWWNQHGSWHQRTPGRSLRWFLFDDRGMYRPGETVHLKGWVRAFDRGPGGSIEGLEAGPTGLEWRLYDAQGVLLSEGEAQLDEGHGFDLELELPATPNLGPAHVELSPTDTPFGGSHRHDFQIQEFRRPEFEVSTTMDPGPYLLGERAWVEATASYYSGGALPSAPVEWVVRWSQASFSPPGHEEYRFGHWVPWWSWGPDAKRSGAEHLSGSTNTLGSHTLQLDFLAVNPPIPMSITAEATITDVNRQRWTDSQSTLMHPAALMVGLKPDKAYYGTDDPVSIELITVDPDGAVVPDRPVELRMERLEWARVDGEWSQQAVDAIARELRSEEQPTSATFEDLQGGSWQVSARVEDDEGRPSETRFTLWVAGGSNPQAPARDVEQQRLTLVPDQRSYAPGDTAEILVQSPFWPAEGLLRIERNGLMHTEAFTLEEPSTTLRVPISEAHLPHVWIEADVVGYTARTDDEGRQLPDRAPRVAFATGQVELKVPPAQRTLEVQLRPQHKELAPGGQTEIELEVRHADGRPARADVAVVAVDEAVLALSGYTTPDPIAVFYAEQSTGVQARHQRGQVVLADPLSTRDKDAFDEDLANELRSQSLQQQMPAAPPMQAMDAVAAFGAVSKDAQQRPMPRRAARKRNAAPEASGERGGAGGEAAPVTMREDFAALALFAPRVQTDAQGRARTTLSLPDSLTRYRIMAVAVAGDTHFGSGESTVTARKPVMLRPSPPRFLNFGDRAELPLVVQNQTDAALEVDVVLRAGNASLLPDLGAPPDPSVQTGGRRLQVPAHDRVELRIPIATDLAGTARFQALAVAGSATDAASFSLPVWTPATSEAFATYGEIDDGAIAQPVEAPSDVWPGYGGLEVSTSSTAVQALTDALLYLHQYPYDCSEQIASRTMAVAALRDVLEAFSTEQLPPAEELRTAVESDLERLQRRQQGNGGWGFYGSTPTEPFLSTHVADAVARSIEAGYPAPGAMVPRMRGYLQHIERHIPPWYSRSARWLIRAHALNVRQQLGDADPNKARALFDEAGVEGLPLEAQGWLLPVLHAAGDQSRVQRILRHLDNRISETAAGAQFDVGYTDDQDYVLLHSSRRTDGILLEALIQVAPEHDVIPKLVRGLLGHRVQGRWSTTQENAYILLALHRYFDVFEATTPDFVARVWLGERFAGQHAFRGRSTERARIDVPMGLLSDPGGTRDLILAKEGPGRLYYRIGLRYAPRDLQLEAADRGFEVVRRYEAVDDPDDVRQEEDGTWRIRAGARVRSRVSMVAPARRTHVMLTDPLPAGLEAMNPGLAVTGSLPEDPQTAGRGWWWRGTWYQHQNLRDERAEAYTTLLWHGVWEYSYVAIASTPGIFVVPPAKAEEMYHPETFGRSASDRVIIE